MFMSFHAELDRCKHWGVRLLSLNGYKRCNLITSWNHLVIVMKTRNNGDVLNPNPRKLKKCLIIFGSFEQTMSGRMPVWFSDHFTVGHVWVPGSETGAPATCAHLKWSRCVGHPEDTNRWTMTCQGLNRKTSQDVGIRTTFDEGIYYLLLCVSVNRCDRIHTIVIVQCISAIPKGYIPKTEPIIGGDKGVCKLDHEVHRISLHGLV